MSASVKTHDHKKIQKWAEDRNGVPAKIKATGKSEDDGVLRIHFPDKSDNDAKFEEISWDDFFDNFDKNKLDLLYQDEKADGQTSTFHKFIERE
jgi:hypothetical protein